MRSNASSSARLIRFARRHKDTKRLRHLDIEKLCTKVVDAGFNLHKDLGPGLLESAYEVILAEKLRSMGLDIDRQVPVDIDYAGLHIERAFKIDLLVERRLIIEIKSVERTLPVHSKQLITYLRFMNLTHGFVMNFGTPTFKEGVKRVLNDRTSFVSSCLRANPNQGGPE